MNSTTFPAVPSQAYATVRPLLHSGDLLLCAGISAFSRLIQTATRSVWSHIAFIIRLEVINRVMVGSFTFAVVDV